MSNLTDALIEFKRNTFGESLLEVNKNNYYKIGSKIYIKTNANTSKAVIKANCFEKELVYTEIASKNPELINEDKLIISDDIKENEQFKDEGFYRSTNGKIKKNDYSNFINLVFPTERFYIPLWYNKENYNRIDYKVSNSISIPNTNMIKTDILSNIKEWLLYVYLETEVQLLPTDNIENIPQELRNKTLRIPIETSIQKTITYMFNTILGENDFKHSTINRKRQSISFSSRSLFCNDIDQLSEGQISLFAIGLSIIKEWDIEHDNYTLEEIKGIVIIDEADLGLHINYAHYSFPRLIKLFPNIQFIITTHSPFMVSGLLDCYGDDIDILSMPDGTKINDVELFEEMKKARELFNSGIEKQKEQISNLKSELDRLKELTTQVVVYTEGETDKILLEKALNKLEINDLQITITPASSGIGNNSDSAIKAILQTIQNNPSVSDKTVIGMFDRDSKTSLNDISNKKIELNKEKFIKLCDKLYAFSIPVPHNRSEEDQISIEHYFTDDEIKTPNKKGQRLFLGNEFYKNGNCINESEDFNFINARKYHGSIKIIEHEQNSFVTDKKGDGDYSLSKQRFAEAVRDDIKGFDSFDFSEFNKIFDVIRSIITDSQV